MLTLTAYWQTTFAHRVDAQKMPSKNPLHVYNSSVMGNIRNH